jgi:steroid delta-isomerase-like uncharacterized protein
VNQEAMMSTVLSPDQIEARVKLVDEHIRAENAHDVDGIMKTFGKDPTFVLKGDTFTGHEGIRALYQGFGFGGGGGFSQLHVAIDRRHVTDDVVILEVTLTGEHSNTWQGIPATGRKFKIPVCAVIPFDQDSMMAGERVYLDGALLLRQLGVLS